MPFGMKVRACDSPSLPAYPPTPSPRPPTLCGDWRAAIACHTVPFVVDRVDAEGARVLSSARGCHCAASGAVRGTTMTVVCPVKLPSMSTLSGGQVDDRVRLARLAHRRQVFAESRAGANGRGCSTGHLRQHIQRGAEAGEAHLDWFQPYSQQLGRAGCAPAHLFVEWTQLLSACAFSRRRELCECWIAQCQIVSAAVATAFVRRGAR
jgi:hypothetical protein